MSDIVSKINKKLEQLGKYKPSAKEIVIECFPTITKKLADGWSFDKLAKVIRDEGCIISSQTLKSYYNKINLSIKSEDNIQESIKK